MNAAEKVCPVHQDADRAVATVLLVRDGTGGLRLNERSMRNLYYRLGKPMPWLEFRAALFSAYRAGTDPAALTIALFMLANII